MTIAAKTMPLSTKEEGYVSLQTAHAKGELDDGLHPYLIRLNEHPAVATHWSCSGHYVLVEGDDGYDTA